jgi:pilus assembly protein Flp/PilA
MLNHPDTRLRRISGLIQRGIPAFTLSGGRCEPYAAYPFGQGRKRVGPAMNTGFKMSGTEFPGRRWNSQVNGGYNQTNKEKIMFKKMCKQGKGLIFNQRGQGLVEYALILVLIAVAIMAAVSTLKNQISTTYSKVGSSIN